MWYVVHSLLSFGPPTDPIFKTAKICQGHLIKLYQLVVPTLGTFSIYVLLLLFFKAPREKPNAFRVAVTAFLFDVIVVVLLGSFGYAYCLCSSLIYVFVFFRALFP